MVRRGRRLAAIILTAAAVIAKTCAAGAQPGDATRQFEQAKSDVRVRAEREGSVVNRMSAFEIVDASGRPRLMCEGFDLRQADIAVPTDTYVCVGVAKGKFIKMRTSMRQRADSQAEVRRFADAWVAKLWNP
jgi:hypothetical protein